MSIFRLLHTLTFAGALSIFTPSTPPTNVEPTNPTYIEASTLRTFTAMPDIPILQFTGSLAQLQSLEHPISHIQNISLGTSIPTATQTAVKPASQNQNRVPSVTASDNERTTTTDIYTQAKVVQTGHAQTSPSNDSNQGNSNTEQTDLYWLSRVIEAEAGGESQTCKQAVGEVILNRVHSPLYPNTIKDVIFQQDSGVYEFTCVQNGWIYHAPSQSSIQAAEAVLANQVHIVPSALVFYVSQQTPPNNWVRTQPVIQQIGPMTFAE